MAFRLRHWLGVVGLLLLAVAAWRLPLDFVQAGSSLALSEEEVRHRDLVRELRQTRAALDQVRRASRLPASAVASAEQGVSVFIPEGSAVSRAEREALRELVLAEARALEPNESDVLVGYGYDGDGGGETGLAVSQAYRLETYLGEHEGISYCLQVLVTRPQMLGSIVSDDLLDRGWTRWTRSLLGPCAFYATYGLPGGRIRAWMEGGGIDFAFGRRSRPSPRYPRLPRRTILGITTAGWRSTMAVERCLTGDAAVCGDVFTSAGLDRGDPAERGPAIRSPVLFSGAVRSGPFPAENWFLFSDLEREFGTDAFTRFWTSEQDVRAAFESTFGVDLGEWLVRWLDRGPGIERATPVPTLSATFGSLLLVSLMTGLATLWQWRRTVD